MQPLPMGRALASCLEEPMASISSDMERSVPNMVVCCFVCLVFLEKGGEDERRG